ncbi:MAG: glycoside hydrolase family 9 protein [Chitinispirillales bacterium]|nr:glycoside hydrolase family 9 protein [Chitinispirillales bacterium]
MQKTPVISRIRRLAVAAVFLSALAAFTLSAHATTMENIRLNQTGYYPESRKVATVVVSDDKSAPSEFLVVGVPGGRTVFRGKLSAELFWWEESGERGFRADFSAVSAPGRYKLVILGDVPYRSESYPFTVSDRAFKDVAVASMRTYYFQRCSYALARKHAGKWARAAGHPDLDVTYHPSSGHWEGEGKVTSPGGWYDAGDFGKYVVNSGITVGTLLAFYELFPNYFPDKSLDIPESGSGRPDILDEVKFNLDWMKTMQDVDGGVFFKLTTLSFPGYIMPDEDRGQRFIIGKSTTSSLNFAAAMAMAARVYAPFDSVYAKNCAERALLAWEWAVKNPGAAFKNPADVKTGEYRDATFDDEFIWAAAELFITTKEKRFADFLKGKEVSYSGEPSWQNVHSLAALSLASVKNGLDAQRLDTIRKSVTKTADKWLTEMDKHLYRMPNMKFIWGSNSSFANMGVGMIYAHIISGDSKYLLGAVEIADYLLGKNAVGISFVSAFGTKAMSNPHHRQSVAGKVGAIPGFLAGGPNAGQQDSAHGVTYSSKLPAKSYEDAYKSYASNEVAINWNAPAVFLFGAIDALMRSQK